MLESAGTVTEGSGAMCTSTSGDLFRSSTSGGLSRRGFLVGLGISSAAALLAACGTSATAGTSAPAQGAPPSATQAAASGAASGAKVKDLLPTYVAYPNAPKAELPSTGPGIDDAYTAFPAQPFKSVQETPGRGGDINVVSGSAWPPYTPADQNPRTADQPGHHTRGHARQPGRHYRAGLRTQPAGDVGQTTVDAGPAEPVVSAGASFRVTWW